MNENEKKQEQKQEAIEDKALDEVNGGFGIITYKPNICSKCGSNQVSKGSNGRRWCDDCGHSWRP